MRSRKPVLPFLVALAVAAAPARALGIDDPITPSTAASGGTGIADPRNNDAIVLDPATLGLTKRYDLAGYGTIGGGFLTGSASVVDSHQSEHLAVGVGYRYAAGNPPFTAADLPGWAAQGDTLTNHQKFHDVTVGLAVPFDDRRLSVGIGGGLTAATKERRGNYIDGDLDFGLAAAPVEWLAFGLAATDVLPITVSTDHPFRVGAGAYIGDPRVGSFELDAKYRVDDGAGSPLTMNAGFCIIGGPAEVRGGWRYDGDQKRHAASFGLGYTDDTATIDASVEVPFASPFAAKDVVVRLGFRAKT